MSVCDLAATSLNLMVQKKKETVDPSQWADRTPGHTVRLCLKMGTASTTSGSTTTAGGSLEGWEEWICDWCDQPVNSHNNPSAPTNAQVEMAMKNNNRGSKKVPAADQSVGDSTSGSDSEGGCKICQEPVPYTQPSKTFFNCSCIEQLCQKCSATCQKCPYCTQGTPL